MTKSSRFNGVTRLRARVEADKRKSNTEISLHMQQTGKN